MSDDNAPAIDQGDPHGVELAQLCVALDSRDMIGQAKGIIRLLIHTDSQSAFEVLVKISTDTNRKLRDVATVIADCAATSDPLPSDIATSWRGRTRGATPTAAGT